MTKFLQVAPADHNYCIFVYIPMFYQFIVIAMLLILDYIMTMFVIFLFHIIVHFFCIYLPCPVTAHYRVHPRWWGQRRHGWGICHKGYISMYNKQLKIMTKSIQEAPAFHECCIFLYLPMYVSISTIYWIFFLCFHIIKLIILWHFLYFHIIKLIMTLSVFAMLSFVWHKAKSI